MNDCLPLLEAVLEQPDEPGRYLVLADWLEEQGAPAAPERAALLRLQEDWAAALGDSERQQELEAEAREALTAQPDLAAPLRPLLEGQFPVLSARPVLPLFLMAGVAPVVDRRLAAGTVWEGQLHQGPHAFPTTLRLRKREGNAFEGDMTEDFTSLFGTRITGRFYFRGAVAGPSRVAFVTYRMTGAAAGPGLYQFRLSRRGRLNGTWLLNPARGGRMWLKQMSAE
jgi:uncharacterized protein (TIGR02996 family)